MVTTLVAGAVVSAPGASANSDPATEAPQAVFAAATTGEAAIENLGDGLEEAAAELGLAPDELEQRLRSDEDLSLDVTGRLVFSDRELLVDAVPDPGTASGLDVSAASAPPTLDLAQTFLLHSNPGSKRVIYLDFDGHTVTGTGWNTGYAAQIGSSWDAAGIDLDADPLTFSDAEKTLIQYTWMRMAEDYAPFDVDVTTEEPAPEAIDRTDASDDEFGTRVVITPSTGIKSVCGCGGIAYVGAFDSTTNHAALQPAFVFIADNAKNIAEAGSHEVGHNLGLSHDGQKTNPVTGYYSGHADWAPIMGVGYYKEVTQFSKGEYTKANNKEDDFAVIQSNGLRLRDDEAGGKTKDAAFLGGDLPIEQVGFITDRKDVDVYRFNAGSGSLTVDVAAAQLGANLDVQVDLFPMKGKKLEKKLNPTDSMGAGGTYTVTEGTYYLAIRGGKTGSGSKAYSNYGSVGAYTITITGEDFTEAVDNKAPKAKVSLPSATIGVGPITLSDAGSYDLDGDIASTSWTVDGIGDSTGRTSTITVSEVGTYTGVMTVTDTRGATAEKKFKFKTLPAITVDTITPTVQSIKGKNYASATVRVVDANGDPVSGVKVSLKWTGTGKKSGSGTTGADGTVLIKGPKLGDSGGAFDVNVTKVRSKTHAYNGELTGDVTSVTSVQQNC
ncbi:MAG: zinc-dependent metalloprotease family protein [Ilumatobacteraceae bacterium]